MNAGVSVSRVGGAAQTKIIKKLGGGVRLSLAQYRELAAFAQFASDLDAATRAQLERGQRVMELMKQKQYAPMSVADMGASLYAVSEGYMDDLPLAQIQPFEKGLHQFMHSNYASVMDNIVATGDWSKDIEAAFKKGIADFKKTGSW